MLEDQHQPEYLREICDQAIERKDTANGIVNLKAAMDIEDVAPVTIVREKRKRVDNLAEAIIDWGNGNPTWDKTASDRIKRVLKFREEKFRGRQGDFMLQYGDKTLTEVDRIARNESFLSYQRWAQEARARKPELWEELKQQCPNLKWYNFKQKFEAAEKRADTAENQTANAETNND